MDNDVDVRLSEIEARLSEIETKLAELGAVRSDLDSMKQTVAEQAPAVASITDIKESLDKLSVVKTDTVTAAQLQELSKAVNDTKEFMDKAGRLFDDVNDRITELNSTIMSQEDMMHASRMEV